MKICWNARTESTTTEQYMEHDKKIGDRDQLENEGPTKNVA